MKQTVFIILALVCVAVTARAWQVDRAAEQKHLMIMTPEGPNIGLAALSIQRELSSVNLVQLKGNVEIKTKDMILHADEAVYNETTGEIEARGVVHLKLETQR